MVAVLLQRENGAVLGLSEKDIERPSGKNAGGDDAAEILIASKLLACDASGFQVVDCDSVDDGNYNRPDSPDSHVLDNRRNGFADTAHGLPPSKFQKCLRILKEVLLDRFLISLLSFIAGVQFAIYVIERGVQ